jgi:hypothetical protein
LYVNLPMIVLAVWGGDTMTNRQPQNRRTERDDFAEGRAGPISQISSVKVADFQR